MDDGEEVEGDEDWRYGPLGRAGVLKDAETAAPSTAPPVRAAWHTLAPCASLGLILILNTLNLKREKHIYFEEWICDICERTLYGHAIARHCKFSRVFFLGCPAWAGPGCPGATCRSSGAKTERIAAAQRGGEAAHHLGLLGTGPSADAPVLPDVCGHLATGEPTLGCPLDGLRRNEEM